MQKWKKRFRSAAGKLGVPCVVSERWLRFRATSHVVPGEGDLLTLDVMTGRPGETDTRKLCRVVVAREDLFAALNRVHTIREPEPTVH